MSVRSEQRGPVTTVVLDRPHARNAVDAETAEAFRTFDADGDGGTVRLPQIVGLGRALDLILTGRPVHADEALRIGLADRVVPDGAARAAAEELALQLAEHPQPTLRADRLSVYECLGRPVDDALALEFVRGSQLLDEAREGAKRFRP